MNARLPIEAFLLSADQSLGHIAVQLPGATAVFRRAKLDFCCGGQVSLRQAAAEKGLDLQALLAELGALQRTGPTELPADTAGLIEHILSRYHAVHRENPDVPAGLAELLEGAEQALLEHMAKEEQVLFPALLKGNPAVRPAIAVMRFEHVEHGAMLERLSELTHGATPPPGACNTWRALYGGIAQLSEDLQQHIHIENNILFAQLDAPVSAHSPCCGSCGG